MRFCLVENYWPFLHAESLLILMQYVDNIDNMKIDSIGMGGACLAAFITCVCNDMT